MYVIVYANRQAIHLCM